MGLTELWNHSREQLADKHIQQIIAFAGNGKLLDGSDTSIEFRRFLFCVPSEDLIRYTGECLKSRFDGSGYALQDIVNQVGGRLGFDVIYGRYKGIHDRIGYDGIWRLPDGEALIVEVKTTDTYRIDLDTIAKYRQLLVQSGEVAEARSSILIVVGREDTGGLEVQIRGSRHAWDIRLISIDALARLMNLKEQADEPNIVGRIYDILIPRESTKVNGIIELLSAAVADIRHKTDTRNEAVEEAEHEPKPIPVTSSKAHRLTRTGSKPIPDKTISQNLQII